MDFNFEEFLESGPKLTTIIVLTLILVVYVSGFVIVNTYLSKYHIRQIDLFQPAFIAAGLFYAFINFVSMVIAFSASYVVSNHLPHDIKAHSLIFYLLIAILSVIIFEFIAGKLTALIMEFARREASNVFFQEVSETTTKIMLLLGLSFFATSLLLHVINKLTAIFQASTFLIACILFLFVQSYSLLTVANNIYEQLPITLGGGQPQNVLLLFDVTNAHYLDSIDDNFDEGPDLLIDSSIVPPNLNSAKRIPTKPLSLFWQLSGASIKGESSDHAYYVRPKNCNTCPILRIPEDNVYGIIYLDE